MSDQTLTRAVDPKNPLAAPRNDAGRRKKVFLIATIAAVLAVVLGVLAATHTWPFQQRREETVVLIASDGTQVTVTAMVVPDSLRIIEEPKAFASTTWAALTAPVRIEAKGLDGNFHVTMKPGPGIGGSAGAGQILCQSTTAGPTPVGSLPQPDGTLMADTSCATLLIGEPQQPKIDDAMTPGLEKPANASDPVTHALLAGRKASVLCTTDNILVGSRQGNGTTPLCIELLPDRGTYRVAYANWKSVPYVFGIPDGVTPAAAQAGSSQTSDTEHANPLLAYITGDRGRRSLLVGGEGTFEASYAPETARPGSVMAGMPDVAGWILYALRENLVAVAGNNQSNKRMTGLLALIDRSVAAKTVTDCASEAAALPDDATVQTTVAAVRSGYASCLPRAVTALAATYAEHNGGNAERIAQTLTKSLNATKGQDRRADTSFQRLLLGAPDKPVAGDPVRATIPVSRFMTKNEVFALPVQTPRGTFDASRCPAPPAENRPRPVGLGPDAQCFYLFEADLDGNGTADRVMTWTRGRPGGGSVQGAGSTGAQGAAAYLDNGKVAVLSGSEAQGDWMSDFEAVDTAHLSNDRRAQLVVEYETGANTSWFVVLGLGSDGNLHLARERSGDALRLAVGGGLSYASGHGCYSRDGRGRIALYGWQTPSGLQTTATLEVTPVELNDLVATRAGDDLTYVTPASDGVLGHDYLVGGACDTADPGRRGDYGVHIPGARTQGGREAAVHNAAQRAVQAVVTGDEAAIRTAFAPEAVPQAVEAAKLIRGSSELLNDLRCEDGLSTAASGLRSDVSCQIWLWFSGRAEPSLSVALGQDAQGQYRAVGMEVTRD